MFKPFPRPRAAKEGDFYDPLAVACWISARGLPGEGHQELRHVGGGAPRCPRCQKGVTNTETKGVMVAGDSYLERTVKHGRVGCQGYHKKERVGNG